MLAPWVLGQGITEMLTLGAGGAMSGGTRVAHMLVFQGLGWQGLGKLLLFMGLGEHGLNKC